MTNRISKKSRKQSNSRTLVFLFILISIFFLFGTKSTASSNIENPVSMYTTVEVTEGDTLWDIASQINKDFYNGEANIKSLIEHIKTENHIKSIVIRSGEQLKVAVNLEELK